MYVAYILKLGKSLEALNEKRVDKVTRLKAAERDRDGLSASKDEAQAFIDIEEKIRHCKNTLYQVEKNIALKNIEDFSNRVTESKTKLDHERKKVKEYNAQFKLMEKEYESRKAAYDQANKELISSTAVSHIDHGSITDAI